MTIRTRLSLWYAVVLTLSLLIIGIGTYAELAERHGRVDSTRLSKHALNETGEMLLQVGLPAVLLGFVGGWWLTRRALAPVAALTESAEHITERNLSERLPRTCNGDELDRLTEVLNTMTARLNDSFTRIRDFTLNASHELKTPLTVLCCEAETGMRQESLTAAEREYRANLFEELLRLSRIVDGLTLLAKADAGMVSLAPSPVRLDVLVRDSFADAQILAESQEIRVEMAVCEEITVLGDIDRLRQLLVNLEDNAIKFNQPQGWVIMALQRSAEHAEFVVTNSGPGISPEAMPHVFDRFYRCDPAHSNTVEGCGLGLSISQWIVSAHQGSIQIASELSKQTVVTVRLPLCASAVEANRNETPL